MSDFEYEDEFEYENDEQAVEIENLFYTAEDNVNSDPTRALREFLQVVDLDSPASSWTLRSLSRCVQLELQLALYAEAISHFRSLLAVDVGKSELTEAVTQILSNLPSDANSADSVVAIYQVAMETLASNFRVWFSTGIRLLRHLHKSGNLSKFPIIADLLFTRLCDSVPSDRFLVASLPQDKISGYLDLLALVVGVETDRTLVKRLYENARKFFDSGVVDVRTLAVLKAVGGEVAVLSRKFPDAYERYLEAFRAFQEAGDASKAAAMLKLAVLSNLLAEAKINPFDTREAKALLLADHSVARFADLKTKCDQADLDAVIRLSDSIRSSLSSPTRDSMSSSPGESTTMNGLVDRVVMQQRERQVERTLSGAVVAVRVEYLASKARCSVAEMRSTLLRLVLAGRVQGRLVDGQVFRSVVNNSSPRNELLTQVNEWALAIKKNVVV